MHEEAIRCSLVTGVNVLLCALNALSKYSRGTLYKLIIFVFEQFNPVYVARKHGGLTEDGKDAV